MNMKQGGLSSYLSLNSNFSYSVDITHCVQHKSAPNFDLSPKKVYPSVLFLWAFSYKNRSHFLCGNFGNCPQPTNGHILGHNDYNGHLAGHKMAINIVVYGYRAKSTIKTNNLQKKSSEYLYHDQSKFAAIYCFDFLNLPCISYWNNSPQNQ